MSLKSLDSLISSNREKKALDVLKKWVRRHPHDQWINLKRFLKSSTKVSAKEAGELFTHLVDIGYLDRFYILKKPSGEALPDPHEDVFAIPSVVFDNLGQEVNSEDCEPVMVFKPSKKWNERA